MYVLYSRIYKPSNIRPAKSAMAYVGLLLFTNDAELIL